MNGNSALAILFVFEYSGLNVALEYSRLAKQYEIFLGFAEIPTPTMDDSTGTGTVIAQVSDKLIGDI